LHEAAAFDYKLPLNAATRGVWLLLGVAVNESSRRILTHPHLHHLAVPTITDTSCSTLSTIHFVATICAPEAPVEDVGRWVVTLHWQKTLLALLRNRNAKTIFY